MKFARLTHCGVIICEKDDISMRRYDSMIDEKGWVDDPLVLAREGDYIKVRSLLSLYYVTEKDIVRYRMHIPGSKLEKAEALYQAGNSQLKNIYILCHMNENGKWIIQ